MRICHDGTIALTIVNVHLSNTMVYEAIKTIFCRRQNVRKRAQVNC
ncbi:unnamed protein product [Onchocerca flexuosa]|uniref:Transposase n=1 Tax=Onchocerca flexuosa TaxID=387005 RepID=A0A183HV04_9BILA|nr:unnamed protein product [Onchocerca flexuosa]